MPGSLVISILFSVQVQIHWHIHVCVAVKSWPHLDPCYYLTRLVAVFSRLYVGMLHTQNLPESVSRTLVCRNNNLTDLGSIERYDE